MSYHHRAYCESCGEELRQEEETICSHCRENLWTPEQYRTKVKEAKKLIEEIERQLFAAIDTNTERYHQFLHINVKEKYRHA